MPNFKIAINSDSFRVKKKSSIEDLYDQLAENQIEYEKRPGLSDLPELNLPDSLGGEKVDFDKKDEETLKKEAEELARPPLDAQLNKDKNQIRKDEIELSNKLSSAEQELESGSKKLESKFADMKNKTQAAAISNGIARSSIISQLSTQLGEEKAATMDEYQRKMLGQINSIGEEIELNGKKLEDAIASYDEKLVNSVSEKLQGLIEEQTDRYMDVVKYNANIDKKELDYQRQKATAENQRAKANADLKKSYALYGSEIDRTNYMKKNLQSVRDYVGGLSTEEAINVVRNDKTVRDALGAYYILLAKELEQRK